MLWHEAKDRTLAGGIRVRLLEGFVWLSLIDLHLNVVSVEMNRVMRVMAVVSVLGLIPAVVGGLFGMNLADNP